MGSKIDYDAFKIGKAIILKLNNLSFTPKLIVKNFLLDNFSLLNCIKG